MMKNRLSFILAVILALSFTACTAPIPEEDPDLRITIPKIGKADSIVITGSSECVVIDTGESDDYYEIESNLQKLGIESIDHLILTHFDKDHIGSAPMIMENFVVDEVLMPDYTGNNQEYDLLMEFLEKDTVAYRYITKTESFSSCGCDFVIYPPYLDTYADSNDNNHSLITAVKAGSNSYLFAGDAEEERLTEIMAENIGEFDFLKMPHHGNYNKKLEAFIASVDPGYAVITCSDKNPPDKKTLALLKASGVKVYQTKDGDITILNYKDKIGIIQ